MSEQKLEQRVLILEDEKLIQNLMCLMFKSIGFNTDIFSDPIELIEKYKKSKEEKKTYNLVLLDMNIHDNQQAGEETLKELYKINNQIKAIFMTGSCSNVE
jgi:CheY-like chemotaxis protein